MTGSLSKDGFPCFSNKQVAVEHVSNSEESHG